MEYQYDLTEEKISLHDKYIEDMKANNDKLIEEKVTLIGGIGGSSTSGGKYIYYCHS